MPQETSIDGSMPLLRIKATIDQQQQHFEMKRVRS